MSRLYEALTRMRVNLVPPETAARTPGGPLRERDVREKRVAELACGESVMLNVSQESRLVALTGRGTLGADKFRALANRLINLRKQKHLRSLQVTSSGVGEGKTVVAANLALTFAVFAHCQTLLVEGDLHCPAVSTNFGLRKLSGLVDWWQGHGTHLASHIRRIQGTSLWLLPIGCAYAQASEILASQRFQVGFADIAENFEWVVVDSPPMSPVVDVNLWSRLVDGTLLVVREGVTPMKRLRKSLATLEDAELIGVVLNEASDPDGPGYQSRFYAESSRAELR